MSLSQSRFVALGLCHLSTNKARHADLWWTTAVQVHSIEIQYETRDDDIDAYVQI